MWTSNDENRIEVSGRMNGTSNVVALDERAIAAAMPAPSVANLNVTKSSKVHIGPKFVSVTQNVQNAETVKELPLPRYLWNIVKNSSRTERLSCAVALLVLITCITLIVYFTLQSSEPMSPEDLPPDVWNITREMWLAQPYDAHTFIMQDFRPTMLIIIHHTVSQECTTAAQCSAELRNIQNMYLRDLKYDLPYSFVVGNDGRVYEARGWNVEGAHTFRYNLCAHAIAFTGDYRAEIPNHSSVSELQLNRTRLLLNEGVRSGILRPDYLIAGASDLADTMSPGSNLIEAFSKWKNYDHQHRFRGLNCTQMQEKFGNVTLVDL